MQPTQIRAASAQAAGTITTVGAASSDINNVSLFAHFIKSAHDTAQAAL